eukprot:3675670-Heterocapsa_arctica.AAC.1
MQYDIARHISTLKLKMGKETDDNKLKKDIGTELKKKDELGSTQTEKKKKESKKGAKKEFGKKSNEDFGKKEYGENKVYSGWGECARPCLHSCKGIAFARAAFSAHAERP